MTNELTEFFSRMRDVKIEVQTDQPGITKWIPTGEKLTSFQKYLAKREIEFYPGLLKDMIFEDKNDAPEYPNNPFKLVMLKERNILSLVNVAPKRRTVVNNPMTGKNDIFYSTKFYKQGDTVKPVFVAPKFYRRLIVESTQEVAIAQPQESEASAAN